MRKIRESNIELLRIVLMLMIVSHHIIVHGMGLKYIKGLQYVVHDSTYVEILLNSFLAIGVNGFIFISGYYGIRFNVKRVVAIVAQAVIYSVLFYLVFNLTKNVEFNSMGFVNSFFPISTNLWWFITTYLGLYFIAPFLNIGVKTMLKTELLVVLIGFFVLNCVSSFALGGVSNNGYDIFNFIFLYLIGRFMNVYEVKVKHPGSTLLASTSVVALIAILLLWADMHTYVWQLFYYNNPVLILSAISLFFVFLNLKIGSNSFVNGLAQLMLGVYMIHDYTDVRVKMVDIVVLLNKRFDGGMLMLMLLGLIVAIFVVSCLIEYVRMQLSNALVKRVTAWERYAILKEKITVKFEKRFGI